MKRKPRVRRLSSLVLCVMLLMNVWGLPVSAAGSLARQGIEGKPYFLYTAEDF